MAKRSKYEETFLRFAQKNENNEEVKEPEVINSEANKTSHKLRHTSATLMYQNGVDIKVLKEILGHESISTTEIYTHIENKELIDALNNNPLSKHKKSS